MIGTRFERPGRVALALAALAAAFFFPFPTGPPNPPGAAQVTQIGKTKRTPKPACPKSTCEAVGKMTGFQVGASGSKRPFRVRKDGSIVAWSLAVSRPNKKQRKFFGNFYKNNEFGTAPTARLAILTKSKGVKYKLRRQSPVANLSNVLNSTPIFSLKTPLRVKAGDIVALSVPTWAPAFATDISNTNTWRASRAKDKCDGNDNIKSGSAQQKVGGTRSYGCTYNGARLLYWAYFVKG
jgi:hypothetical protein